MKWISHDDRLLEDHLAGLKTVVKQILPEKNQNFFTPEELKRQVLALIAFHDLAKASVYFQLYLAYALVGTEKEHRDYSRSELKAFIENNRSYFYKWKENPALKNHSLFGAWMSLFFWGEKIIYAKENFLFLEILKSHHGSLKNFELASINPKSDKETLNEIAQTINLEEYQNKMELLELPFKYGNLSELLNSFSALRFDMNVISDLPKIKDSSYYFQTLFLYSFLLSADKGDMMLRKKEWRRTDIRSQIIDDFKSKFIQTKHFINTLREEAYQTAISRVKSLGEQNFYSITLPTGLGKTFTAYKTALQIKQEYAPNFRIVYCLPFTSIIDQNAEVFNNILKSADINSTNIGIHHHLSIPDIKRDEAMEEGFYPNWEYITEGWQSEITITTFVQLWESIFANHNRQLRKFHNLVNSIIILDEVQSINPKLFPAFEFVMKAMAKYFNTKFIFVTATQPVLLGNKVKELCFKNTDDYFFSKVNRTILDTSLFQNKELIGEEDLTEIVLSDYEENEKSILVICNTIRFSQNLRNLISSHIKENNLFYLSASIIPYSREKTLDIVREKLENKESIILISTQVVEAGVDIDFDTVYRDFAPLSSINQAAGRCNRNAGKDISKVILFRSGKDKIYDPTQLDITKNVLETFPIEIPENTFYNLNQKYFQAVKKKIQEGSDISNDLIKDILTLKFENVGTESKYRLFVEKYKTHSYFIAINKEAENLWNEYLLKFEIEDFFKRKQQVQLLMPKLMKYVVNIPEYVNPPTHVEQEFTIIKRDDWKEFYDTEQGYKSQIDSNSVAVF